LLEEPDTVILLDKGFGDEEVHYIDSLIAAINDAGHPVAHASFSGGVEKAMTCGVIGIETGIGEMAALIKHADEFIGYDSACQHIAAAQATPCITIFAGSNNMRFIRRWSAHSPESSHIVHVDTLTHPGLIDTDDIMTRIMQVRDVRTNTPDKQ
jgi:ADP-heptose:LPS heptosyltransferase